MEDTGVKVVIKWLPDRSKEMEDTGVKVVTCKVEEVMFKQKNFVCYKKDVNISIDLFCTTYLIAYYVIYLRTSIVIICSQLSFLKSPFGFINYVKSCWSFMTWLKNTGLFKII